MRTRWVVAGALVFAALVFAPAVRADPGPAQESAPASEPADPQGADAESAPRSAGDAPGHAAEPGHSGDAPGHAAEPGASGDAPRHQDDTGSTAEDDQRGSVGQAADAAASADQRGVDNTAATLRVDEPGNGKKVGQENRVAAESAASAKSAVDSPGDVTVAQSAEADAGASQSDVSNTSIVVRVGSAGDDEGVSQANVATGSASATSNADDGAGVTDASALATQDSVANTSVSVRVFSPGDDGPVSQLNAASATADASPGGAETAIARQEGVQNTTVAIRVESPGSSATPTQQNRATVVTSPSEEEGGGPSGGVAVAVAGDARNTVLSVAVGGASLDRPGSTALQVWVWTWVWQRDEGEALSDLAELEPDSWSWSWDGANGGATPRHGNITAGAADDDDRANAGSLEWRWDWNRAGITGWSWDWNRTLQLSCTSCIWIWNWSWSWTGQPGDDDVTTPPAGGASSTPAQLNAVTAQASATASAGLVQTVVQSGSGTTTQFAGQLAEVSQAVSAVASAQQANVSSVAFDDGTGQSNVVAGKAHAVVAGTASQGIAQSVVATGTAGADQWGGQQLDLTQVASARASATQRDVLLLGGGSHAAASDAIAGGTAAVEQRLAQDAAAGAGAFSQWAGQLALIEQAADTTSVVLQTGSVGSRRTGGAATAAAQARDLALLEQHAEQSASRDGGLGSQSTTQLTYIGQEASASAVTVQQAGAATLHMARSDAEAFTRAKVLQDASQRATGASILLQVLLQQAIVVQRAAASSTSNGGIAGRATVVDCAVVHQGATQSIGAVPGVISPPDDLAFCLPPTGPPNSSPVVLAPLTATGGEEPATTIARMVGAGASPAAVDVVPLALHEGSSASSKSFADGHHPWSRSTRSVPAPARLVPGHTQFSAPLSPQARIDTRSGSHAGAGDAGREPPLPPAGDPPRWISALAAAASGAGPSGIAAILFAFALAAPLLLRSPQGSVVRRPTDVLARIDVPV
jgi:hypothetical protein